MGRLWDFITPDSFGAGIFAGGYLLFFTLILIFIFLYGISIGRTRAMLSLLAIYAAYALTLLFPYRSWLENHLGLPFPGYILTIGLFIALYTVALFVLNISLRSRMSIGDIAPWQIFVVSVLQVGLLMALALQFIPVDALPVRASIVLPYVAGDTARFLWASVALMALPFMKGGRRIS